MATPAWVRDHRAHRALTDKLIRADQHTQALRRITPAEADARDWTPRRGMSFATE